MSDDWESIREKLKSGRLGKKYAEVFGQFPDVSYQDAIKLADFKHAAHAMIWAKNPNKLWSLDLIAAVMMQMRFDGCVGFPGGFVEFEHETIEEGLNRELEEEIDLDPKFTLTVDDYFYSSVNYDTKMVLHFYVKEVLLDEFVAIEKHTLESDDYGGEVLGIIRPPLFETSKGRGFSDFIQNRFIGNSLVQLLRAIHHFKILPAHKIIYFLDKIDN